MYDYLTAVTPDYVAETLNITPHNAIGALGQKTQAIHEMDDGSLSVVTLSSTSFFDITLQWDMLSCAEYRFIMDLYHDPLKANASARTFPWVNPVDGLRYTVRFLGELSVDFTSSNMIKVNSATLRIEGKYPL
jgi:hypothetical protein